MLKKQDRTPVRTPAHIEQKYDLSSKDYSEIRNMATDAKNSADRAVNAVNSMDKRVKDLEENGSMSLETVYPVGSIYLSVLETNPADLFGFGTWVQIKDKFLLSAGDTYSAGSEGGEAEHSHTLENGFAKITYNWASSPGDFISWARKKVSNWTANFTTADTTGYSTGDVTRGDAVPLGGSTDSGNNMPPYLAVYMWQRTA